MQLPRLLLALVVACLPALVQVGAAQERKLDRAAASRGRSTFKTFCASCHGSEAKGDGPLAEHLKARPADLTGLSARNDGTFPFEKVIDTINHGRRIPGHGTEDMPSWGDAFAATEGSEAAARAKMEDLAHFLWSLQPTNP